MTEELPGVEALRYDGNTFGQLAAVTGPGAARTTAGLAGRRILSDATMDALRGLPSRHAAEKIAALADGSRAAYLEQLQAGGCDAVALGVSRHSVEQQEIPGLQPEEC